MAHAKNRGEAPNLTAAAQTIATRWWFYGLWIAASLVVFFRPVAAVVHFAAYNDDASHIFLIPFISAAVICLERQAIFRRISYDFTGASLLGLSAAAVSAAAFLRHASWSPSRTLSAYTLALMLFWMAGFALFFGRDAARSSVVARKPSGEEVALETAELAALEGKGNRLSPEELGLLSKQLASATDPTDAARLKERLTRGFYGI